MPSHRTIKKSTRWTSEEWRHIEQAAAHRGVPPLRYVREAALAARLPPRAGRRGSHELIRQLKRVLNNLHQLRRVAEEEAAEHARAAIQRTIDLADAAVQSAAGRPGSAHPLIIAVRDAGRFLNDVTHGAHIIEELPADDALHEALHLIESAVADIVR
jgi:hypothetical protein